MLFRSIKEVFCDTASLTSVNLLRVLLAERGLKPEFKPLSDYQSAKDKDYVLLIGNPGLDFLRAPHEHEIMDLGTAWLELGGEVVVRDLQPGETLRVHPGHVGAFQASVSFQITRIQGIRNMFFGGDGIFLAALTGPGRIWLQTLPLANLAHALQPYLSSGGSEVRNVGTAAVLGGIVGSMFENR